MQVKNAAQSLIVAFALIGSTHANADNGAYTGAGGSFSTGTAAGTNIVVQGLPLTGTTATLSFSCPITGYAASIYSCAGGSVTVASTNKALTLHGSFTSGSMSYSASGGGKGGHVTYTYQFNGSITGRIWLGGVSQTVNASIAQVVSTTAPIGAGAAAVTAASFGWNSAYSPVIVADSANGRLLGADNIAGNNLVTYGTLGSGIGQFEVISGLAQDKAKNIYIADSVLDRIVRINDLTGAGWVDLGTSGSGANQFSQPAGIAIDSAGKIWVADAGNNRIVRFDDMTGTNWTAFGTLGAGANQFSGPNNIAFDPQGRIYVTDAGNNRLVRFDDLTGTNWTALTIVNIDPYGYPFNSPVAVAIRPSGQIDLALGVGWLLSFSDMTGANGVASVWGTPITGMSMDGSGTMYVSRNYTPALAQVLDAAATGYTPAGLGGVTFLPGPILAAASTSPPPAAPVLSTAALAFASRNVGEAGLAQPATLSNLGAGPLSITSVTASPDFELTDGCPATLIGGSSCGLSLKFDPTTTGSRSGTLAVETSSMHPVLDVALSGTATVPSAIVLPGSLSFLPQQIGVLSDPQTLTLSNTGTGPLTITSVGTTGDFFLSTNCAKALIPGTGCTISVRFMPTVAGTRAGTLVISDDAIPTGTQQTIALQGTGSASAPSITLAPQSVYFPNQLTGAASPPQTVTLTNSTGAVISVGAAAYSAGFSGTSSCGSILSKGATCKFHVTFTPTVAGNVSATVSVPITGQPSITFGVSGTGVSAGNPAALSVNPPALDFGTNTQVGDNPVTLSVTITNTAGVPTGLQHIWLSGSPNALSITARNCLASLTANNSCTVQITMQTLAAGTFTANLSVMESSGATTVVPVTGLVSVNGN